MWLRRTTSKGTHVDKHEQTKLVESFMDGMRVHIMSKVARMPEEWNGIELRRYISDEFQRATYTMDRRRMQAYRSAKANL